MKNFFSSFLKIILLNSIVVIFFLILIEIFFGYWFDKDNFGPYMREHRMKNQQNIWEYKNEIIKYNYKGITMVLEQMTLSPPILRLLS